jgi:23S rRNA-/tRNA-specific pseudouridylate synthase
MWEQKRVEAALRSSVGRRKRTIVDPVQGKNAATLLQVLARYSHIALVEARPLTGRTHQIRAHLYSIGCPVLADPLYGEHPPDHTLIPRLALHAYRVVLKHPTTGKPIEFTAPYPQDFAQALETLSHPHRFRGA